jgi:branched-chain amino acid transport system substrate-binding protein
MPVVYADSIRMALAIGTRGNPRGKTVKKNDDLRGVNRRSFLRTLGLASGVAAISPLAPGAVTTAVAKNVFGGKKLKVGLILPRRSNITESIRAGMGVLLEEYGRTGSIDLAIEESTSPSSVLALTRKLVERDKVDVVIAHVSSRAARSVYDYVAESSIPFIEMNAGESIPDNSVTPRTYFRSTLGLWQAHAAMGSWAASTLGNTAAIHTSFRNSGFDFHLAFGLGFESKGGSIVKRIITGAPTLPDHPMTALAETAALNPAVVFASYGGNDAAVYSDAIRRSKMASALLATDPSDSGASHNGARTVDGGRYATTWSASLSHPENSAFILAYEKASGQKANEYAVLGYDTLRYVAEARRLSGSFEQALGRVSFIGPRGAMCVDPDARALVSPYYLRTAGGDIIELTAEGVDDALAMLDNTTLRGGWSNCYLAG